MVNSDKLKETRERFSVEQKKLSIAIGQMEEIKKQTKKETEDKEKAEENVDLFEKTGLFLSGVLTKVQNEYENTFSQIGTAMLDKIFGDKRELIFKFDDKKQKNPSVNIMISQPYMDDTLTVDIENAEGGGIKDIATLALRLGMLELYNNPPQTGPLFLDETFKSIASDESLQAAGEFLKNYAKETERQIILVTHRRGLLPYADKIFELKMQEDKKVEVIPVEDDDVG